MEIKILKPEGCKFEAIEDGFLKLTLENDCYQDIKLYRAFPFTFPEKYISVMDSEGKEIGIIEDMTEFSEDTYQIMQKSLDDRYFSPIITEVTELKEEFGYYYWEAETTAGSRKFTVQGGKGNLRLMDDKTVIVIDVEGNRFVMDGNTIMKDRHNRIIESIVS